MPFHNYGTPYTDLRKSENVKLIVPKTKKAFYRPFSSPDSWETVCAKEEILTSPGTKISVRREVKSAGYCKVVDKPLEKGIPVSNPAACSYADTNKDSLSAPAYEVAQKICDNRSKPSGSSKSSEAVAKLTPAPSNRGSAVIRGSKSLPREVIKTSATNKSLPSSPDASVRRRAKTSNPPKNNQHRRGLIWDAESDQSVPVSISNPILISHSVSVDHLRDGRSSPSGPLIKPRDIEQQESILNKLRLGSPNIRKETRQNRGYGGASVTTKMAGRIQRTIKALYSSTASQKKPSFDLLEEVEGDQSLPLTDTAEKETEDTLMHDRSTSKLDEEIDERPKSDKRANRKRSPKPNRRNNLQVKDVDGSRRFKWRGSVNKIVKKFGAGQPFMPGGTFGVHLEDCPMSPVYEFVPFVVALCCRIIEERGLSFTGIYRVPGNSAALSSLQDDFNMLGVEAIEPQDDRVKDVNVVSSLLKSFFRKLPDPLFTNELYDDFIQGNRRPTPHERLSSLRRLVHMLPGPHYETLKFLIAHLRRVADNCQENKMEVRNLAIVFGPTLVRSTASNNMATMVTDMSDQCRIVESIIEHATWFFLDTESHIVHHAPWTVPVDSSHEPVPSIGFLLDNVGRKPGDTSGNTSDSSKSKCSNESEKDSFSRDVIDLLFGKKWKQMGGRPRAQTDSVNGVDDHGGFEDPQRKTSWVAVSENSGTKPLKPTSKPEKSRPTGVTFPEGSVQIRVPDAAKAVSSEGVVDVSKRLYEFYQEHLDRLSKTNIGQPLPTFSSTESSPQITPKNSSDDSLARFKARPMKHSSNHKPSDPSRGSGSLGQYPHVALSHRRPEFPSRVDAMDVDRTTTTVNKESAGAGYEMPGGSSENELKWSKTVNRETLAGQQEDFVTSGLGEVTEDTFTRSMDSSAHESSSNIQLLKTDTSTLKSIAVVPPDAVSRAPSKKVGSGRNSERSIPEKFPSTRKTAQELYEEKRSQRQQQKRRMVRDKHQSRNPAPDENTFSRCDPKRRVIRSSSGELDPLRSVMNKVNSPPREDSGRTLSAMERLFNSNNQPQHVHIKSIKPHRKSSVTRRHTLSGILDFTAYGYKTQIEGSEKPNPHAGPGLNLGGGHNGGAANSASLYDLSSSCEQAEDGGHILSAMDRLKPRGVTSDLTLENWLVQERRKNKITKRELTSSWNQRGPISSKKSYV